ncbi:Urea amidohydrolase (urease) beta subunit [Rubellimicrobium thermophilum DSM 16684]|uniref:Urea amidohydrolase (Urease) beta subunit n=1 Tax=Rubellimicrobium thermophilum DSM 16684 TaxID=1123069 RepID=S9QXM1_9RHOB|nr:urease subunit beta [Rubellimicrobium thermophilum]EPX84398.1 Urea amidohydrolase (urease) beta subunit [Rubellimicrobium thermophilum DSM 16684]
MIPGEIRVAEGNIELNAGREAITLMVGQPRRQAGAGRLPLSFRRGECGAGFRSGAARGRRLDIPAGTAVRFEPGQRREVRLIPVGGAREIWGFNGCIMGRL